MFDSFPSFVRGLHVGFPENKEQKGRGLRNFFTAAAKAKFSEVLCKELLNKQPT